MPRTIVDIRAAASTAGTEPQCSAAPSCAAGLPPMAAAAPTRATRRNAWKMGEIQLPDRHYGGPLAHLNQSPQPPRIRQLIASTQMLDDSSNASATSR